MTETQGLQFLQAMFNTTFFDGTFLDINIFSVLIQLGILLVLSRDLEDWKFLHFPIVILLMAIGMPVGIIIPVISGLVFIIAMIGTGMPGVLLNRIGLINTSDKTNQQREVERHKANTELKEIYKSNQKLEFDKQFKKSIPQLKPSNKHKFINTITTKKKPLILNQQIDNNINLDNLKLKKLKLLK